jgi:hypothetical protein
VAEGEYVHAHGPGFQSQWRKNKKARESERVEEEKKRGVCLTPKEKKMG